MRALWIVAALVLAGCTSTSSPDTRFPDAVHRFSGTAAEPFEQTEMVSLPAGVQTLMVAVDSDDGFAVFLQGPATKEPWSGQMIPSASNGFAHQGPATIRSLQYATIPGEAGDWTLRFGCNGPCSYTVAVNPGDTIVVPDRFIQTPKTVMAEGHLQDDQVTTPAQSPAQDPARLAMDFATGGAISIEFRDGNDRYMGGWNFNKVVAHGWHYTSLAGSSEAGTWTVSVGCNDACDYSLGTP